MLLSSTCATLSMVVTIYIGEVDPVKKFIGMQISNAILLKVPIFSFRVLHFKIIVVIKVNIKYLFKNTLMQNIEFILFLCSFLQLYYLSILRSRSLMRIYYLKYNVE